ncbi:glycosyl transferase group 1 [Chitinophaga pinensis DSM 2588]|uniref:Glycosyl transferase group 1 n=1 Tax=Chitinophaga pinensis (strain ATCC 43595 / DSM 2588 / LMG 13176 / NBRC 15968 / NCIMB 11800 / UQM 2034) TaxID=485918 RepID=A0A979G0M5_CHIPD|nr:glycosyl transferase group 1 [Chitinophaga pinensis DSM 2588]
MIEKKRKCLLLLTRIPYPPVGGDKLKSYHLIKILNKHYDLNVIVITDESADNADANQFLSTHSAAYKIFSFPKHRFYINALAGLLGKEPIQVAYYYFREVKKYIDGLLPQTDFIIANLIRTVKYIEYTDKPKFLDIVDSIAINYKNAIDKVSSVFWKSIYKVEIPRITAIEERSIRTFNATFFVNKQESEHWAQTGKVRWIPNGVNPKLYDYSKTNPQYRNAIVFFGKMDYQPNIDAVTWYLKNVHSLISPDLVFYIVGVHPAPAVIKLAEKNKNVIVTGFIEDPYEIINSARAVIAPMQTGAGIQNKILESMALGKVVVATSLAARPIVGARDGEDLLVSDDPVQFAGYLNELGQDNHPYAKVAANAKILMQNYTWERYEKTLTALIGEEL